MKIEKTNLTYEIFPGDATLPGAVVLQNGINFTLSSSCSAACELCLFYHGDKEPFEVIRIPAEYRVGAVYAIRICGISPDGLEYTYRLEGEADKEVGGGIGMGIGLLDPYARFVERPRRWGERKQAAQDYRACVVKTDDFWGEEPILHIPREDTVLYEMHVRGYTMDISSGAVCPGTFAGIREKIPYLKELGINSVEFLPVFEFDECQNGREFEGKYLPEYWGYNTVGFFAPNSSYFADREDRTGRELKETVRELNRSGIEVILDVVFNHTGEGDGNGPVISFKGIDNSVFYLLDEEGRYKNYSGCGNTMHCSDPRVQDFIIRCLQYWVKEYHISGFRFDLASILGRGDQGEPLEAPMMLRRIAADPVLADTKLIAEPWDAGGLYQVGSFPAFHRWSEWNGKYRDDMRGYLKGDLWLAPAVPYRLTGSEDLYKDDYEGFRSSVNMITCHDGFTLRDLYSYNEKHNFSNGWGNSDGHNDNRAWNCGAEGETQDPAIRSLRRKMARNAMLVLLCSRGTPMILAGDEFLHTQQGNNNSYCQDNQISWLNWNSLTEEREFFDFVKALIAFRKQHPVLRKKPAFFSDAFLQENYSEEAGIQYRILPESGTVIALFAGREENSEEDAVLLILHPHWEGMEMDLPVLPDGLQWKREADTDAPDGAYICRDLPAGEKSIHVSPRSAVMFTAVAEPAQ